MNLAQIRSEIPEIFHTQTKNPQTGGAENRTFPSSLHAVTTHAVFSERERSLIAVARPSVRLSVCNARAPYSGGCKFR